MKNAKILLTVALVLAFAVIISLIAAFALMSGSCSKESQTTEYTVEEAYAEAQKVGYTGTLEEFIALIMPNGEGNENAAITNIEKTGTDGDVTTYTITFSDGSKIDFTIVNDSQSAEAEEPHTHTYAVVETLEPTCASTGYEISECSGCGDRVVIYTPATGHNWDDGVETTAATCGEAGVKTYTCSTCGATYTEGIPATGEHEYELSESYIYCTVCEQTFELTDVDVEEINTLNQCWTAAVLSEDDKTAYVTAYNGTATEVTVPDLVVLMSEADGTYSVYTVT